MLFEDLGLLFFTVLALTLLFTPLSMRAAFYIGAIDQPVTRSVHLKPMPRLGGLGMVFSLLIGMGMFLGFTPVAIGFMTGLAVILITGLADDIWNVRARWKLLGQLLAAVVFIELSGITVTSLGNLLNLGEVAFSPPVAYAVTLFMFVGTINAFNHSDGLDGLAAGVVAIVCLFFAVFALEAQVFIALFLSVGLLAAVLGFLKFNSFPAKMFMGDTGSLMLGFSVTAIGIILGTDNVEINKPVTIGLVLAMPVIDTLWVMARRVAQGKSPAFADNTHLHHRLLALGLPHSLVVSILYIWTALFGFLALFVREMPEYWQLLSGLVLCGVLYSLLTLCERKNICLTHSTYKDSGIYELSGIHTFELDAASDIPEASDISGEEQELKRMLASLLGRSMKLFPYVILAGLSVPLFFVDSISTNIGGLALVLALLIAVAFPWQDHHQRPSIVCGLFYLCAFILLWGLSSSSYRLLNFDIYMISFSCLLLIWTALKIKFKSHREVFLTSSFELLLISISWFIPYVVLPVLGVSETVMDAAKLSCLAAIPIFIALKLAIKGQLHRNRKMAIGLISLLVFMAMRSWV